MNTPEKRSDNNSYDAFKARIDYGPHLVKGFPKDDEGYYLPMNEEGLIMIRAKREDYLKWIDEENNQLKKERGIMTSEDINKTLIETYDLIRDIINKYMDLDNNNIKIVALWIMGTYYHRTFNSFPYLFFNAMRGSGKTRLLKICTELAHDGDIMASPTEAVLFRTTGTLGIDEFEGVASKDKSSVRELLNAAYKKGTTVKRMKKKRTKEGEELVVESFDVYRPILMANITGMDEVLGDRCISLILEKSSHPVKTKLIEDFDSNESFIKVKENLKGVVRCSVVTSENIYKRWNNYILDKVQQAVSTPNYISTLHTTNYTKLHNTTNNNYTQRDIDIINDVVNTLNETTRVCITTPNIDLKSYQFFKLIDESEIQGRNLELFMPLFVIASYVDNDILRDVIKIAKDIVHDKTHEEEVESKDVMLLDFIARKIGDFETIDTYVSVKALTNDFKIFTDEDYEWLNPKWFGRALKRLSLIVKKRRSKFGIEVILNLKKAQEKLKMFK